MRLRELVHLGRRWLVVSVNGAIYVQDDRAMLTGPYSSAEDAAAWVFAIRPPAATGAPSVGTS